MINDFIDAHAFIDWKQFGEVTIFDASFTKSEPVGRNTSSHEIVVFLNFKIVGRFKVKQQALALVQQLIREAPAQARADFAAHQSVLLDSLNC